MADSSTTSGLTIGWACQSITPDRPVQLHGQHYERVSEHVRDKIAATALALEKKGTGGAPEQALIISCDLVAVPKWIVQRLRENAAPRLEGFDTKKITIAATHTHTAPTLDENLYPTPKDGVMRPSEYSEFLLQRLTDLVIEAWQARKPGGVSWALSHAAVGFNRRVVYSDGSARMYGSSDTDRFMNVEGSQDHGVEIMFTWSDSGEWTGAIINLACPSQVVESKYYVSADFWSEVRKSMLARPSGGVHVLPLCSAAGDQSPRDLVRRGRGEADFRGESGLEEIGRRIVGAVEQVVEKARSAVQTDPVFAHVVEDLRLPARRISDEQADKVRAEADEYASQNPTDGSLEGGRLRKARRVLERYDEQGADPRFPMELHVIRLGDIALATNPFELFLDYGMRIKARSPALQTFVVQLAGDRGMYLPTSRALAGGHYGTMLSESFVGPEGGQALVDRTVELIEELFGK